MRTKRHLRSNTLRSKQFLFEGKRIHVMLKKTGECVRTKPILHKGTRIRIMVRKPTEDTLLALASCLRSFRLQSPKNTTVTWRSDDSLIRQQMLPYSEKEMSEKRDVFRHIRSKANTYPNPLPLYEQASISSPPETQSNTRFNDTL